MTRSLHSIVQSDLVLRLGASLGGVVVRKLSRGDATSYLVLVQDDSDLLLDDGEQIRHAVEARSLEECFKVLDQWRWHRLYPIEVGDAFRAWVLSAASCRCLADRPSLLPKWERLCSSARN